jgi:L-ascorbate metabolism protein UlaG (beta-lactamase superfamily)
MASQNSHRNSNGRFFTPGARQHGFKDLFRWLRTRERGPWRDWIPAPPGPPPPYRLSHGRLRVNFVNHSTVLLQIGELNLLTDPIWSYRASPVPWIGPKRHRAPGLRFEDLPPIDLVLISHNHYDHLDRPTLKRLLKQHAPAIFCPLGVAKLLKEIGFQQIWEMDWWQNSRWRGLDLHCTPAQHFSARTPFDRDETLWASWVLQGASGTVFFAGDTAFGPHLEEIAQRFPNPRLALLPIGAYRPEWFMGAVHMSPDEAVQTHRLLGAQHSVGIHYGTFLLADDGETEPTDRIRTLMTGQPDADRFWLLNEGEGRDVPATGQEDSSSLKPAQAEV